MKLTHTVIPGYKHGSKQNTEIRASETLIGASETEIGINEM